MASARLVVKDNKLINARYDLGVAEMRLFLSMITQIRREDSDFKTYRIQISDFADSLRTQAKNVYDRAQETSKRLMEKVLEIEEEDGPLQITLLSSAKYYKGKGYVDLRFDPALKPYLLQLKETFTAYDIRNVLQLQSGHSIRIYELLKQYERIGERTIAIVELKDILGVSDQYSRYNDFKRYVLLQAQKELKQYCDIVFEFKEKKQGRKIVAIWFAISRNPHTQATNDDVKFSEDSEVLGDLMRMGLSREQSQKIIESKTEATIRQALDYTQNRYRNTKGTADEIRNPSGYLLRVLESGGDASEFVEAEQEKEQEATERIAAQQKVKEEVQRQERLVSNLKDDYRTYRKEKNLIAAQGASEHDWMAFEGHVKGNPYLTQKYISEGRLWRESDGIEFWLGSFLVEQQWPDTAETFMEWVFQTKGYKLEKREIAGEANYRIIGQQEILF